MRHVFISYSSLEHAEARKVRDYLEKNGIPCWMAPRDIPAGSNYTKEIPIAIRECGVFVVMLSRKAQESNWVMKELDMAVNCRKVILPFMLEDCELRDEFAFLLTGCQRFDAFTRYNESLDMLLKLIRKIIPLEKSAPMAEKEKIPVAVPPEKPAEKPAAGLLCPACNSSQVVHQPKRLITYGFVEKCYLFLFVPFVVGCGIAGGLLLALLTCWGSEELIIFCSFLVGGPLGVVAGIFLGKKFVAERLRRRRVRRHIDVRSYRCQACMKQFSKTFSAD